MTPLGRAGQAAVAVEAGPDEAPRRAGRGPPNMRRDPLEERRLGDRSGGRQQAEDAPTRPDRRAAWRRRRRSSGSASHQRPGSISVRRRWVGRPSSSRISASRRSTGIGLRVPIARLAPRAAIVPGRRAATADGMPATPARAATALGRLGSSPDASWPGAATVGPVRRRRDRPDRRRRSSSRSSDRPAGRHPIGARRRRRPSPRCPPARASRWPAGAAARPGRARRGSRRAAARSGRARRGRAASRPRSRSRSAPRRRPRTVVGRSAPAARTGPCAGTRSGSPAPPGSGSRPTFARVRGPGGSAAAGREQLDDGRRVLVGIRQPRAEQPVAGRRATDRPRRRWPPARRRPAGRRGRRAPWTARRPRAACPIAAACQLHGGAARRPASASIGRSAGRLAPEDPGRRVVGGGQAIEARPHRRLAEDQPDARGRRRPAVGGRIVAQERSSPLALASPRTAVAAPSPRLRRSSPSRAWIGPGGPALEPLDEPAHARGTRPRRRATGCARGTASRSAAGRGRTRRAALRRRPGPVARRLAGRIEWSKREPERGQDRARRAGPPRSARGSRRGRRAGAAVCRSSSSSGSVSAPSMPGKRAAKRGAHRLGARHPADPRRRSSASSGAWRCSEPPRWSRQTVQR